MIALMLGARFVERRRFIVIIIRRVQCPKRKKGRLFLIDIDGGMLQIKKGVTNNRDKMAS